MKHEIIPKREGTLPSLTHIPDVMRTDFLSQKQVIQKQTKDLTSNRTRFYKDAKIKAKLLSRADKRAYKKALKEGDLAKEHLVLRCQKGILQDRQKSGKQTTSKDEIRRHVLTKEQVRKLTQKRKSLQKQAQQNAKQHALQRLIGHKMAMRKIQQIARTSAISARSGAGMATGLLDKKEEQCVEAKALQKSRQLAVTYPTSYAGYYLHKRQANGIKQLRKAEKNAYYVRTGKGLKQALMRRFHVQSVLQQHKGLGLAVSSIGNLFKMIRFVMAGASTLLFGVCVLILVLVLALVLMIPFMGMTASPMGIVFANEGQTDPRFPSLGVICTSIANDAQTRLEQTIDQHKQPTILTYGTFLPWDEALAIFAVHTVTRKDGKATDVIEFNDAKVQMLEEMYRKLHPIEWEVVYGQKENRLEIYLNGKGWGHSVPTFEQLLDFVEFDEEQKKMAHEVRQELKKRTNGATHAPVVYSNHPAPPLSEEEFAKLLKEAEKHLGKPYRLGTMYPPYEFDCGLYTQWVFAKSGIASLPPRTASAQFDLCEPIRPADAQKGDLVFFYGTYDTNTKCSHVGIYIGDGYMIHAGSPVKKSDLNTPYWQKHLYSFGRVRR